MATAPDYVSEDAEKIRKKANAHSVIVEDAVDDEWYIRVEGPTDELDEESFDNMVETIRGLLSGSHKKLKIFYGAGIHSNKYLVRLEYE